MVAALSLLPGRQVQAEVLAAHGALQRSAAATDDALDVYRLALLELLPVLQNLLAAGSAADANLRTTLPPAVHSVLQSLQQSVAQRVQAATLVPLARAYHDDVQAALEDLATANVLAQVLAPAQQLQAALQGLQTYAQALVEVLGRPRPSITRGVSLSSELDNMNEALQQLALSEGNIADMRRMQAPQAAILQGFARLEIDLGHVLDVIYSSQEEQGGSQTGFDLTHAIDGMAPRVRAMQTLLDKFAASLAKMAQNPNLEAQDLQVVWQQPPAKLPSTPVAATITLSWQVAGAGPAALWQLRRRAPSAPEEPPEAVPEVMLQAAPLATLPLQRRTWQETWTSPPSALPAYQVVAVSPFGVAGKGVWQSPQVLATTLLPVTQVHATALQPNCDDANFYRHVDAVQISWQLSPSDHHQQPYARAQARAQRLPTVARYLIYRVPQQSSAANAPQLLYAGHVAAGSSQFMDNPGVAALQAGLRYYVEAQPPQGSRAPPLAAPSASANTAAPPALSPLVQADVQAKLTLAAAGAAWWVAPGAWERSLSETLRQPVALQAAQQAFLRLPQAAQRVQQQRFWQQASAARQQRWYASWRALCSQEERAQLYSDLGEHLVARDRQWVLPALWLVDVPELQAAIARYWQLLDATAQQQARQALFGLLNQSLVADLHSQAAASGAATPASVWLAAATRRQAWWEARDSLEKTAVAQRWASATPDKRRERLLAWLESQPHAVAQALLWPEWAKLTHAEQQAWTQQGYLRLPAGLWPALLAWQQWDNLSAPQQAALLADDVPVYQRWAAWLLYSVRPLDVFFHFKLLALSVLLGALMVSAVLLRVLVGRSFNRAHKP